MPLTTFPAFERLASTAVAALAAAGEERDVPAGTDLIVMGTHGDSLFLLLDGTLDVLRTDGKGERLIATIEAPAVVGEMELLTAAPRTATVRSKTVARVFALPFGPLHKLLDDGDVAALQLMRGIAVAVAKRLTATVAKLTELESEAAGPRMGELRDFRHKLFFDWG